jgi:Asp-tRNA(Asn)/Glu-tRNA(Gln) amidotransferase A subunit family amidase
MDDVEVAYAPAWLQARWIRDKEISCRELVDLYLGRIDRVNVALNCFITVAREYAQEAADEADRKAAGERGPFHGVPIAIKDMADTAEIRTTWGSAGFRDRVPHRDSPAVRRLKASGFLILGKTNTPEFASGPTDPVGYGPCRNPWDPDRSVFGSSGGSAAAAAPAHCGSRERRRGFYSRARSCVWCCGLQAIPRTSVKRPSRFRLPQPRGADH